MIAPYIFMLSTRCGEARLIDLHSVVVMRPSNYQYHPRRIAVLPISQNQSLRHGLYRSWIHDTRVVSWFMALNSIRALRGRRGGPRDTSNHPVPKRRRWLSVLPTKTHTLKSGNFKNSIDCGAFLRPRQNSKTVSIDFI